MKYTFQYLLYLGILNIVFGFVWKWVFVLPVTIVLTLIKLDWGVYILKAFGSYLLVSLTAITSLWAMGKSQSLFGLILISCIGGFVLIMSFASNTYAAQKQAMMNYDYRMIESLKYDVFYMLGSLILYIVVLFVPEIAINPLTIWLFDIIEWAKNFPIIGWLIGIAGVIFMVSMIFYGIIALGLMISLIFAKFRENES
ncbi:MAG: hypothetical protein DRH26_06665 [Deltaproteobacteria bacterium]|nr:MAG: hypothetical protein DRH26_06665 [Deltaproteobacteria bacterium]